MSSSRQAFLRHVKLPPGFDADGESVAEVDKTLYIRRGRDAAPLRKRAPAQRRVSSKA